MQINTHPAKAASIQHSLLIPCHHATANTASYCCTNPQIYELDEELQSLRKQHQEQAQQLELREAEAASLRNQLTTWRAVKDAEAASLSSSNKQLAEQLAKEIAHGKTLDKQLTQTHTDWVSNSALHVYSQCPQMLAGQQQMTANGCRTAVAQRNEQLNCPIAPQHKPLLLQLLSAACRQAPSSRWNSYSGS
jgi:DNA anti-recombination protein RmuC